MTKAKKSVAVPTERRNASDRRKSGTDRRVSQQPVAVERRQLERRTKVNRRRQIDPTTCERDYQDDEVEFMRALEEYKRKNGRMFPTCSEVLEVLRGLGYTRVAPAITPAVESAEPVLTELPTSEARAEDSEGLAS